MTRSFLVVTSILLLGACESDSGSSSTAPDDVTADGSTQDVAEDTAGPDAVGDTVAMPDIVPDVPEPTEEGPQELAPYSGGTCPQLTGGDMIFTSGGKSRSARIFLPEEPTGAGVLFMWHGLGDSISNFSNAMQAQYVAQTYGWIVVVPAMEPAAGLMPALWGFPSLLGGVPDADLALFDDLSACIDATWDIDRSRIYSLGFSAGALWTSYLILHRSEVLAGAMILSGGVSPPEEDPPTTFHYETPLRPLPVFLAHGGTNDIYNAVVVTLEFHTMTDLLAENLAADGHFAIICRHGTGHFFTPGVATSGFQFLTAHTWENTTSFWQENGLPGAFDPSCSIQ